MAPNKFEKQLKDTLERRSIAPSSKAWSQLDTRLDEEKQKRKFPIWWLGIAATFIGVFLAITFFNSEDKPENDIVNETKNEIITIPKNNTIKNETIIVEEQPVKQESDIVEIKVNKEVKDTKNNNITTKNNNYTNKTEAENVVVTTIAKAEQNKVITPLVILEEKQLEDVLVVISPEDKAKEEASKLLDAAYTKVAATHSTNNTEKIDANSLLEEVEIQSEVSLKNRLFQVVKSGYETVKTTVVERNY